MHVCCVSVPRREVCAVLVPSGPGFRNPKAARLVSVLSRRLESLAAKERSDEPSPNTKTVVTQLQSTVHELSERIQVKVRAPSEPVGSCWWWWW